MPDFLMYAYTQMRNNTLHGFLSNILSYSYCVVSIYKKELIILQGGIYIKNIIVLKLGLLHLITDTLRLDLLFVTRKEKIMISIGKRVRNNWI